jgi:hypothetical protein
VTRIRHHELQREPLRFEISVWCLRTPRDRQIRAELESAPDYGSPGWHRRRATHSLWWFAAYAANHRGIAREASRRMLLQVRKCWNAGSRAECEKWFAYCYATYRELVDSGATEALGEALLREQHKEAVRRRSAGKARQARVTGRDLLKTRIIESARDRKARNPALSKLRIAALCWQEFNSHDTPLTEETIRGWLKGIDL